MWVITPYELNELRSPACWVTVCAWFLKGHGWPGEVQQHHIGLLQRSQGNSAGLWHHQAGDLWRSAQMDENDRQGTFHYMLVEELWNYRKIIQTYCITMFKRRHFFVLYLHGWMIVKVIFIWHSHLYLSRTYISHCCFTFYLVLLISVSPFSYWRER